MTLICAAVYFKPSLDWAISSATRDSTVEWSNLSITIPKSWQVKRRDGLLFAFKPCYTALCSKPRSLISATQDDKFIGNAKIWQSITGEAFKRFELTASSTTTFQVNNHTVTCYEAFGRDGRAACSCIIDAIGANITFEGSAEDLASFRQIVQSMK